jgi:hypothetical protein
MQEMLFQRPKFLKFPGAHAPRHPWLTRACGSRLTHSAIANYPGGEQGKWALWQFCPTTILKKCSEVFFELNGTLN